MALEQGMVLAAGWGSVWVSVLVLVATDPDPKDQDR